MSTKPEVSDEELREYMNFDELLQRRNAAVSKMKTIDFIRKGGILSAAVITLSIVWFIYRGGTGEEQVTPETTMDHVVRPGAAEPVTPITEHDSVQSGTLQDMPLPVTPEVKERPAAAEQPDAQQDKAIDTKPDKSTNSESAKDKALEEYEYSEAVPVDGFPALYEYFNRELVYPPQAIADSVQGIVTGSFIIGVGGTPENITIENSLGKAFDDEVKRLIGNMPAWKAATVNGSPVPSRLSIPVTFRLHKVNN